VIFQGMNDHRGGDDEEQSETDGGAIDEFHRGNIVESVSGEIGEGPAAA